MRNPLLRLPLAIAALALAACTTVGPEYRVPPEAIASRSAASAGFTPATAARHDGDAPSPVGSAAPLPPYWWRLYRDARLDGLVEEALAHNTDLRQAAANLERVRAVEREVSGAKNPELAVDGGPSYGHLSGVDLLAPGEVPANAFAYDVGASLSYQVDLFGQIRRAIEAARAGSDGAQAALDLVRVNVAAGTARAYAEACSTGLRIDAARRSIDLQQQAVDLSVRLQEAGRVGLSDTSRARGQLKTLAAALPTLEAERSGALYRLATLTGRLPQDFPKDVATCSAPPRVATPIPVGDGAALLRRRPDVRHAERALAEATARIGVATADLYPKIAFGLSAASLGPANDFGGKGNFAWSVGPLIHWTIPSTGIAQARIAQAEAGTRGALARFDGTVLTALRETETALDGYARELDRRAALEAARDENAAVARQARELYRNGKTGSLESLDAERVLASSEAALAASEAALADDQVTLFLALGGGWEQQ